ncbi:MAG: hypothetical protein WCO55_04165 [Candidatus Falkowbacteria bacterium]
MKKIILPSLLVLGGLFLGWYGLINYQLYANIKQQEATVKSQTAELDKITKFLTDSFGAGQK